MPAIEILTQEAALTRLHAAQGIGAPFQSAGWIEAWTRATHTTDALRLVEINAPEGRWLLPIEIARRAGCRVAQKAGGGHASVFTPLRLGTPPPLTRGTLAAAAGALQVDALLLTDCPRDWAGTPLFAPGFAAAPDVVRTVTFDAPASATPARLYAGEAGKKLRAKGRKLGAFESGFLTGDAASGALAAMLGWKAAQFAGRGITDPFADADVRNFLALGLREGGPLRLFALTQGTRVLAVMVLAQAGGHASGMANAYDPAPELARAGPGDVLLGKLVEALAEEDARGFDLGVGEARYKRLHCPDVMPLQDIAVGITPRGVLLAQAHGLARRAKGSLKRHEAAFAAFTSLRARLFSR